MMDYKFEDDIALGVYLDFKREKPETIVKLNQYIGASPFIRSLTVAGSPNPLLTDCLFEMLASNQAI